MLEILHCLGSWKGIQTASGGQDMPDPVHKQKETLELTSELCYLPSLVHMLTLSYALDLKKFFPVFLLSSSSRLFILLTVPITSPFPSLAYFFPTNHSQVTCENMSIFYISCCAQILPLPSPTKCSNK